ncbi:YoaK family protein [Enterococcus sp. LJL99]
MFKFLHTHPSITNTSRLFAILMAFSGGAIDVYSHNYFHGLVATQTGNVVLLASNLSQKDWSQMLPKTLSIVIFTVGFLIGIWVKHNNFSLYWRCYTMLPVIITSFMVPLFPEQFYLIKIGVLAFGTGLLMLTFTGSKVEDNPYTIMMTSGNFRKMLYEWYLHFNSKEIPSKAKRNAQNYTLVVLAFLVGAFSLAFIDIFLGSYSIWLPAITFLLSFSIEIFQAKKLSSNHLIS